VAGIESRAVSWRRYRKREKAPAEFCAPYVLPKWPTTSIPTLMARSSPGTCWSNPNPPPRRLRCRCWPTISVAVTDWMLPTKSRTSSSVWVKVKIKEGEGLFRKSRSRSPIEHSACFVQNGRRLAPDGAGRGRHLVRRTPRAGGIPRGMRLLYSCSQPLSS